MTGTNFKTANNTFRQLFGNGLTYRIPRFQRDYSWTETEWEDLWADILDVLSQGGESAHYMGYLVLQTDNDKEFDVIDGQQRLTTLSILILAVLRNLNRLINEGETPAQNKSRLDQIRQSYIGYLDPVSLVPRSKLNLNRNNDIYYQQYLVPLVALPRYNFKSTEHSMRKASEWFEARLRDYAKNYVKDDDTQGVTLARLVETLSDKLFFTVITVDDELNAYKVFETLNARGVRLSATDLLKNYLFSVLDKEKPQQHERELVALDDRWEGLVSRMGEADFPDFLRIHWMSRNGIVRRADLFKTIRDKVSDRASVFQLLQNIDVDVDNYLSLTKPDNSEALPAEIKELSNVLKLFQVRQPYTLLLAAMRIFDSTQIVQLLRAVVAASFRYNVIGNLQANEQERVFSEIALKLARQEIRSLSDLIAALRPIYPNDNEFRGAFEDKSLKTTQSRNSRIVTYILAKIEYQKRQLVLDEADPAVTLEHVLPQNPDNKWPLFSDSDAEANIYRLGNMILLERGLNKEAENLGFEGKAAVYQKSIYHEAMEIAALEAGWTPQAISNRQKAMSKLATAIWRIPQLG